MLDKELSDRKWLNKSLCFYLLNDIVLSILMVWYNLLPMLLSLFWSMMFALGMIFWLELFDCLNAVRDLCLWSSILIPFLLWLWQSEQVVTPRLFSLVCFRLIPSQCDLDLANKLNRELLDAVNSTGKIFISHTVSLQLFDTLKSTFPLRKSLKGLLSRQLASLLLTTWTPKVYFASTFY